MSLLSLRPRKSPSATVANRSKGCGEHRGIFWRYDQGRWQKAFSLHSWQTLEVLPSRSLSLWLCSVHNFGGGGYAWPALVGSVGAGGSVEVVVEDSFNERLGEELNISSSLVPPVQLGALGPRADVEVSLKGSGNVAGFGALHVLAGGQLVAPVVSAGRLEGGEVTVTMEDCGNVRGAGRVSVVGSLLSPLASAGEVEGTELSASSKGCGNVEARRLEVARGRLAPAALEIKGGSGAKLEVKMEDVGGFRGKEVLLREGGALVAGLLNVSEGWLRRSRVQGEMQETAVVQAEVANLSEAMLVEAAFRLPAANVSGGSMKLTLKSSAALKDGQQLEMKGSTFMGQAIYAREGAVAFQDLQLNLELEEVAMAEAKEISLLDFDTALLWAALHVDEVVADGGSLDVRLRRVGECRVRAASLAGYLAYGVVLTESFTAESRSKLDVRIADSFNCYVETDLSVQIGHVRNVLFGDWVLSKASIEIESSLNRQVGGELGMGSFATVIRDVHRGEAKNSSFSMCISKSMNSKVGGSLQVAGSPLVEDIVDGIVENGSYTVRLEDSVNLEAGGDLLLKASGSMFLRSVFDGIELGSLGMTLRKSLNVEVGGTATIQRGCYLASNLIFDDLRNATLSMEVEDSANVKAASLSMPEDGYLIGQLVDGNIHRHSSMSISVRQSANVKAASLSMSSSQLLGEVIDDDVDNCSVKVRLKEVANVEATYVSLRSESSLVRQLLSSDDDADGSVLEAKCSNMAKVRASNVSLSSSALVQKGYYADAFNNSEVGLSFDDVANVVGRRAAYLQGSSLIKNLFHADGASGTFKARLLKSASLESEATTRLVQSSLLGKALFSSSEKLELHLGVTSTGLLCRSGEEGGIVASVDNVDSPLCADGPGLVTADSCEARFCSI